MLTKEQYNHVQELITDLRSGKHRQTTNNLRKGNAYCCLGRACDISGLGKWEISNEVSMVYDFTTPGCVHSTALPKLVMEYFGFNHLLGLEFPVQPRDVEVRVHNLADLNDTGFTFLQIADVISWWLTWPENIVEE